MAKIYLHGWVQSFAKFTDAVPVLSYLFDQIQNAFNAGLDESNIKAGSLSPSSMADGVGRVTSGQYMGDGTVDRVINIGFTPRWVHVLSHTDSVDFLAMGSGAGAYAAWHRTTAGVLTGDGVGNNDWQGIVTNGFKLGHLGSGLSNKNTQTFSYVALR